MPSPFPLTLRATAIFLLATFFIVPLRAQMTADPPAPPPASPAPDGIRPDHLWTVDYLSLLLGDTKAILTSPTHWDQDQWLEAGAAVSAVGATSLLDRTIRDHVQANRSPGEDRFMNQWQNLGSSYSFGILAGFEAWGEIGGNVEAKNVAMDGLTSSIIAAGLIAPALKYTVGRSRPSTTLSNFKFKPFSNNNSFPSGHATQAFAVATVIAETYHTWWVESLAYGSAALVGYARIEQNAHFASDVVAGSLIGWSVARAVVHRHDGPSNPKKLSWSPYVNGNGGGLIFFKSF